MIRKLMLMTAATVTVGVLGTLTLDAHDHEAERLHQEARANELSEYLTQPRPEWER